MGSVANADDILDPGVVERLEQLRDLEAEREARQVLDIEEVEGSDDVGMIGVLKSDLEILSSFQCERVSSESKVTCDQLDPKYQPLCNSCWVRSWAIQQLEKNGG